MPVTKSVRECYEVRSKREWANITLHCWERPHSVDTKQEGRYYCGEININSSFGTWSYIWTACAQPFKRFLIDADFHYVFTKFMGTKLERYDGDGTMAQIRRDILRKRWERFMDKRQAREVWNHVKDERERITSSDQTAYGYAMWNISSRLDDGHPMQEYFSDPSGWPTESKHDSQAVGFWRELWPLFVDALKAEMQPAAPTAVVEMEAPIRVSVTMTRAQLRDMVARVFTVMNACQGDGYTIDQVLASVGYAYGHAIGQRGGLLMTDLPMSQSVPSMLEGYREGCQGRLQS